MPLDTPTVFTGMTQQQLQATLISFQQAYLQLITGDKPVQASYSQGDGARQVTFKPPDATMLFGYITQLQQLLGMRGRARRPLTFLYGSNFSYGRPW